MAQLTQTDLGLIKRYVSHPSGLGYVADFSNPTFSVWFRDNWNVDIDDPKYEDMGTSKGNRLVSFCRQEDHTIVFKVLRMLRKIERELGISQSEIVKQRDVRDFDAMLDRYLAENFGSETPTSEDEEVIPNLTRSQLLDNVEANDTSIVLVAASAVEGLSAFKEVVRSDNYIAIEQPQLRDDLIQLLDALVLHIERLLEILPSQSRSMSEKDKDVIASWTKRYINGAIPKLQEFFAPESLGSSSVPVGVILTCGGLGSLLTGFSPVGFGAGSVVGKLIVGEMKSGMAADQITERLSKTD